MINNSQLFSKLDSVEDFLFLINADYQIESCNKAAEEKFGSPQDSKCFNYFQNQNNPCGWCQLSKIKLGEPVRWHWYHKQSQITYQVIDIPLLANDGRLMALRVMRKMSHDKLKQQRELVANDQSRQQATIKELQLERSQDLLEQFFSVSYMLIAYMDRNFNFIKVNRAYAQADGKTPDYFIGKNHFDLYPNAGNKKIFKKVIETGETYNVYSKPFRYPNAPGRGVSYWDWTVSPVKGHNKEVTGIVLSLINVTSRVKAEKRLRHLQKQMAESKRLSDIGTLAASIAHQLRNPLGVIKTSLYNIRRKKKTNLIDKHLANIDKKIVESNQIISNLLAYTRLKMPQHQQVNIYSLLKECLETRAKTFPVKKSKMTLDIKSLKRIQINIDPYQIKEVLDNIINNAYQAIDSRTGKISVSAGVNKQKQKIEIAIADNGPGIDPRDRKHIFEPFYTTRSSGTGLGLTIAKELINLHRGQLVIAKSKLGGALVKIILPITAEGFE
jgi:PAS domain S-box-containing protein